MVTNTCIQYRPIVQDLSLTEDLMTCFDSWPCEEEEEEEKDTNNGSHAYEVLTTSFY